MSLKRVPIIATAIVIVVVAAMIALGIWQLQRAEAKDRLIATYAANTARPPIAFPRFAPVAAAAMFRRSSAVCLEVMRWQVEAGRSVGGGSGYRQIASCRTGADGPGLIVDMGVARDPKAHPKWRGGVVDGIITTEPDHTSVLARAFGTKTDLRPMLVSSTAAPGLVASQPPTIEGIANNHRSYAVQWFAFAVIATLIYGLALRRRELPS